MEPMFTLIESDWEDECSFDFNTSTNGFLSDELPRPSTRNGASSKSDITVVKTRCIENIIYPDHCSSKESPNTTIKEDKENRKLKNVIAQSHEAMKMMYDKLRTFENSTQLTNDVEKTKKEQETIDKMASQENEGNNVSDESLERRDFQRFMALVKINQLEEELRTAKVKNDTLIKENESLTQKLHQLEINDKVREAPTASETNKKIEDLKKENLSLKKVADSLYESLNTNHVLEEKFKEQLIQKERTVLNLQEEIKNKLKEAEAERESKNTLSREKEELSEIVTHLEQRIQGLQEEINVMKGRPDDYNVCPKCFSVFPAYQYLERHIETCLDLNSFP